MQAKSVISQLITMIVVRLKNEGNRYLMKRTSLINRAPPLERHYTINQMLHALFQVHRQDFFPTAALFHQRA